MTSIRTQKDAYIGRFAEREKERGRTGPGWLAALRKAGMARFAEAGFPTTDQEEWRLTNVEPIAATPFAPAPRALDGVGARHIEPYALGGPRIAQLVFVDGRFAPGLSAPGSLPAGVRAGSLAEAIAEEPALVEPHLGKVAPVDSSPFADLNTAFIEDGAFVRVPEGTFVDLPIHLLHLSTSRYEPTVRHPRVLILVGGGAQASFVESYAAAGTDGAYFTNAVTEIVGGRGAVVDHYRVQRESLSAYHVAALQARLARDCSFSTHSISVGGALVRNDVNAVLDGEGASCTLNGLFLATGRQHVDNHTRLDHASPHCGSRELYKGILAERARGVFSGRIVVRKDAQKTDSKQTNKNLLLSEDALIDTQPQLEIYADDVKCTHGATIGQIDEDSIFYLRSRGLDEASARAILVHAFAGDLLNRIKVACLREILDELVSAWLPAPRLAGRAA